MLPNNVLFPTQSVPNVLAARLDSLGVTDRNDALNLSTIAYNDNPSFTELWATLAAWTMPATPGLQISGGNVFSTGQGSGSGANHAFPAGLTGRFRAAFRIHAGSSGGSGGVIVGVSSDAAGAIPAAGAANVTGLYLTGGNIFNTMVNGVATAIDGAPVATGGWWTVTMIADDGYITFTARNDVSGLEARVKFARASITVNNIYIFNSDSRTTGGMAIGSVGAKLAIATVSPRAGIEDQGATVHWTQVGGVAVRIAMPPGAFDSRKRIPTVMFFVGYTSPETNVADNTNYVAVQNAFLAAGYAVLSARVAGNYATWGNQSALNAYVQAYQFYKSIYPLGKVVIVANSMGGIESLLTLASPQIHAVAWIGWSPTFSLLNNYNHVKAGSLEFRAVIQAAYGISSDGSNYATATAGHDPALMPGYSFRSLPMYILAASDDLDVDPIANAGALATAVAPYCPDLRIEPGLTGGHSFPAIQTLAATNLVPFANKYAL